MLFYPPRLLIPWLLCLIMLVASTAGTSIGAVMASEPRSGSARPRYQVHLEKVTRSIRWPTAIASAGDDRLFIVEQPGWVRVLQPDATIRQTPFLDIRDRVGLQPTAEPGMLSLAFHPDYAQNGYFYVSYTDADGDLRISRFTASAADPNLADPDSEVSVLVVEQPGPEHFGGDLAFGSDGYLYVSVGDGGVDYSGNAQDGSNLLGTILRLDVDSADPYAVPVDNPFVGDASVRDEIWLLGLRNPWRFSFDSVSGDLFIGDVGGGRYEEINYLASEEHAGGRNYGWPCFEGRLTLMPGLCGPDTPLTFPIAGYERVGECSAVIGGYVYRGAEYPAMVGDYLFADYCNGIIWSLSPAADGGWQQRIVADTDAWISGFAEASNGELYAVDHRTAWVYRVTAVTLPHQVYMPFAGRSIE
jgi:glucose/arabinose dehydrogenase